jgi:hypothetical protein
MSRVDALLILSLKMEASVKVRVDSRRRQRLFRVSEKIYYLRIARRMRLARTIVPRAATPPASAMPIYPSVKNIA